MINNRKSPIAGVEEREVVCQKSCDFLGKNQPAADTKKFFPGHRAATEKL